MACGMPLRGICRYFRNGNCRSGVHCRFLHVMDNIEFTEDVSRKICPHFAIGQCQFGGRCRYSHIMPPESIIGPAMNGNAVNGEGASWTEGNCNSDDNTETAPAANQIELNGSVLPGKSIDPDETKIADGNRSDVSGAAAVTGVLAVCHKNECYQNAANTCGLAHMDKCRVCKQRVLHHTDEDQRRSHMNVCTFELQHKREQREMEEGEARSVGKTCGVCFEVVTEQASGPQRFGILPNCNHCFCLHCIRKWRHQKQFDNTIIRACPECRVASDFVCPSTYWVNTQEQKEKLISDYKDALCIRNCKYFNSGRGNCPFGNKCFYRHAYPDGTLIDVGPPRVGRRNTRTFADFLEPDYLELHEILQAMADMEDFDDLDSIDGFEYEFGDFSVLAIFQ